MTLVGRRVNDIRKFLARCPAAQALLDPCLGAPEAPTGVPARRTECWRHEAQPGLNHIDVLQLCWRAPGTLFGGREGYILLWRGLSCWRNSISPRYAEADVACCRIRRGGRAGGVAITAAVGCVAEIRPAPHHFRCSCRRTGGIGARGLDVPVRIEVIGAPFPGVADGVEQAEAVWREAIHGRDVCEAVLAQIGIGKPALPDVAHVAADRRELVAPRTAPSGRGTGLHVDVQIVLARTGDLVRGT
jgi:hypothetical protein